MLNILVSSARVFFILSLVYINSSQHIPTVHVNEWTSEEKNIAQVALNIVKRSRWESGMRNKMSSWTQGVICLFVYNCTVLIFISSTAWEKDEVESNLSSCRKKQIPAPK
jgi:hypothetical protein